MRVFVALFAGSIGGVLLFIGKIHYLFLIGIGMSAFGLCMYAWKKPWFLSKIRFKHTQPKTAPLIVRIESGRSVSMLEQTAAFKPSTLMVCLYFLLACVAGYIRCALCGYSEQDIGFFIQRKCFATIHGQIVNTPQQYSLPYGPDALRFQVAVDTIVLHYTTRKVSGLVEVMMPVPSFFLCRTDRVVVSGNLVPASHVYEHELYPRMCRVSMYVSRNAQMLQRYPSNHLLASLDRFKQSIQEYITLHLCYPHNYLLSAMLLGQRTQLFNSGEMYRLFTRTGMMHLVAISGFNFVMIMTIVLCMFRVMLIPRTIRILFGMCVCLCYLLLVGQGASVIRAGVMIEIFLFALLLGRSYDVGNALSLAGVIIVWIWPYALFDVGFQLSFICVLSLLVVVPWLQKTYSTYVSSLSGIRKKVMGGAASLISISLGVWLGISPLTLYYFQMVSFTSIVANCVIIPFVFVLNVLGIFYIIFLKIIPQCANSLGFLCQLVSSIFLRVLAFFEAIPCGYIYCARPPLVWIGGYYVCLGLLCVHHHIRLSTRTVWIVLLLYANISMGCVLVSFLKTPLVSVSRDKHKIGWILIKGRSPSAVISYHKEVKNSPFWALKTNNQPLDTIWIDCQWLHKMSTLRGLKELIEMIPVRTIVIYGKNNQENCFAITLKSNFRSARRRKSSKSSLCFPIRQDTLIRTRLVRLQQLVRLKNIEIYSLFDYDTLTVLKKNISFCVDMSKKNEVCLVVQTAYARYSF